MNRDLERLISFYTKRILFTEDPPFWEDFSFFPERNMLPVIDKNPFKENQYPTQSSEASAWQAWADESSEIEKISCTGKIV